MEWQKREHLASLPPRLGMGNRAGLRRGWQGRRGIPGGRERIGPRGAGHGRDRGQGEGESANHAAQTRERFGGKQARESNLHFGFCPARSLLIVRRSMPKKTVPRRPGSALTALQQLGAEIRELGGALGRVISRLEGPEAFATVENLRRLAKARRAGDPTAPGRLAAAVAALGPAEALNQAMAFTLYFELVNLAEENFRIRLLRQRRLARLQGATGPMRESIEAAILELKGRGVAPAQLQALVDRLAIELVFTAHPTESKRRTLLAKLRRLAEILRQRAQPEAAPDPALLGTDCLEREIASLWLTDRSRAARPEVADEARTGLWYFDTTLYEALPRLYADLARALGEHYPQVRPPARWLTFGSWIGGDRDGNPNVTAAVTAEVLLLHRRLAIEKLRLAARELSRTLTVSDRRDGVVPALRRDVRESLNLSAHLQELSRRYPHEPYRLLLGGLRERLAQAVTEVRDGGILTGEGAAVSRWAPPPWRKPWRRSAPAWRPARGDPDRRRTGHDGDPVRDLRPAHGPAGPAPAFGPARGRRGGNPGPAGLPEARRGGEAGGAPGRPARGAPGEPRRERRSRRRPARCSPRSSSRPGRPRPSGRRPWASTSSA